MTADEELLMLEEELKDITPLGVELLQISKSLDCDFECEEKGTCKDKMRCQAELVHAMRDFCRVLYGIERNIVRVTTGVMKDIEPMKKKIELIERKYPRLFEEEPQKKQPDTGDIYG